MGLRSVSASEDVIGDPKPSHDVSYEVTAEPQTV